MTGEPFPSPAEASSSPSEDSCDACPGDCLEACFNDAILALAEGGVRIQAVNCAGCGACVPVCNLGHIRLKQGVAQLVLS